MGVEIRLKEMLLRSGLIANTEYGDYYVDGALLSNSLVVRDGDDVIRYRVERAANGVDLILVDADTCKEVMRAEGAGLF